MSEKERPVGMYRFLPVLYIGCGVFTLALMGNVYSTLSGLLFIGAGVLVIFRQERPSGQQRRGSRRHRADRTGRKTLREDRRSPRPVRTPAPADHSDLLELPDRDGGPGEAQPVPAPPKPELKDGDLVTAALLSRFSPFDKLTEAQRQKHAEGLVVSKQRPGKRLIKRGSNEDLTMYLLEGSLVLKATDGKRVIVESDTPRSRLPICQLRPHAYSVKTATPALVIMVTQTAVRDVTTEVIGHEPSMGIEVSESTPESP